MPFPLVLELKNCLERYPGEDASKILDRVRFASFLRTGVEPTSKELVRAIKFLRKYSPDQPRVPAGNPDGGQWTSGGSSGETQDGWIDTALLETCENQLNLDGLICTRLKSSSCWAQATFRYSACLRGDPIPFFPYR